MYSMLTFIKSKYRSVSSDEHFTELVRTALTTYQPKFQTLTAYPNYRSEIKYFVLKTRTLLKVCCLSRISDVREPHVATSATKSVLN
jgi:hypothetical protein